MTSVGLNIALAMKPLLPMKEEDDKPTYSKSLNVSPLSRTLRPIFYGGNGRFVMSWIIVFILLSSSLIITLSTSKLESFCKSGSIKGVNFLISFWAVCAFIVVIILVFSNFTRILPSRDHEELVDFDENDIATSYPLLNTSDISILDNAPQYNSAARTSIRYNGALSEPVGRNLCPGEEQVSPQKVKKPRRFTTSAAMEEPPNMRRASSGPIIPVVMNNSTSNDSLRRNGGKSSTEGLAPLTAPSAFLNHHLPSILRSSKPPTIIGTSRQTNGFHHHSIIELAGLAGVRPDLQMDPEFEWTAEAIRTHLLLPILNLISWLPWILALSQYEGGDVLAYSGIIMAFARQIGLAVFIQIPADCDNVVGWIRSGRCFLMEVWRRKSEQEELNTSWREEERRNSSSSGAPHDPVGPPIAGNNEEEVEMENLGNIGRLSAIPGSKNEVAQLTDIDKAEKHSVLAPENTGATVDTRLSLNRRPAIPVDYVHPKTPSHAQRRRLSVSFDTGERGELSELK
jgi:hypothetical protein